LAISIVRKVAVYEAVVAVQDAATAVQSRGGQAGRMTRSSSGGNIGNMGGQEGQFNDEPRRGSAVRRSFSLDSLVLEDGDSPSGSVTNVLECLATITMGCASAIGWESESEDGLAIDIGVRIGRTPRCFSFKYLGARQFV